MHDEPRNDASDPSELTQRHAVPPVDPAVSSAPVEPSGAAGRAVSDPRRAGTRRRGVDPDPDLDAGRRRPLHAGPRSARRLGSILGPGHARHPRALVRAGADAGPHRAGHGRTRREGRGGGSLVAAALLSAVLASGGTVVALNAVGALDRPAAAPTTPAATNAGALQPVAIDESSATIAVAAKVSPAVVKIRVTGATDTGNLGVIPPTGVGSGVIFDSNGWILTNHHVVEGGEKFDVELKDGRVLQGSVYGIDTLTDLAIVKVDATGLPTAAIGESDALKVGQLVIAIGSPLGTYSNSVTSGIVSAKGRSITTDNGEQLSNLIQTDAAINPGNSGGPLLDAGGNVIGINTAIAQNSNGIGFAIPIDIARPIMAQAVAGEPLSRPYMGIHFVSITRQLADEQKLPGQRRGARRRLRCQNGHPVAGRRGRQAGRPRRRQGRRHHREHQRQGHRRGASARCDPRPVLAGRHGQRRRPARRRNTSPSR